MYRLHPALLIEELADVRKPQARELSEDVGHGNFSPVGACLEDFGYAEANAFICIHPSSVAAVGFVAGFGVGLVGCLA
jgi:hypothetical protein